MRKLKLYLETSVWNFYYAYDAPEKRDITREFFQAFKDEIYEIYISQTFVEEIGNLFMMEYGFVEEALLDENWEKVTRLLDLVDIQTPSPILRMIKAHACLALGHHNEYSNLSDSVYLLDNDIRQWQEWSYAFVVNVGSHLD